VRCMGALDQVKTVNEAEAFGVQVVRQALSAPLRQIAANAGAQPGVVLHKVMAKTGGFGFNAETREFEDLVKARVIDPTKVVRTALENGSSVARILLSTDCVVADKPKSKDEDEGEGGPGMDDMDMY